MTVAGRKPKPLALHILEGNPSHIDLEKRKNLSLNQLALLQNVQNG